MNNITFTHRIKPDTSAEFNKTLSSFSREGFVDDRWDISCTKVNKKVYTFAISDCTVCLITDGQKAMLMHLSPLKENNHNLNHIFNFIKNIFDLNDKNLQAVLIGSKENKLSQDIFKKLHWILEKFNIPTSILKIGKDPTNIAYSSFNDELLITSKNIAEKLNSGKSHKDTILESFDKVIIADFDEII